MPHTEPKNTHKQSQGVHCWDFVETAASFTGFPVSAAGPEGATLPSITSIDTGTRHVSPLGSTHTSEQVSGRPCARD